MNRESPYAMRCASCCRRSDGIRYGSWLSVAVSPATSGQRSTIDRCISQIPSRSTAIVPLVQQQFCCNRPEFSHHLRDGDEPPAPQSAGRRGIGRPPREAARAVRCTTCSSRRRSRGRLHVRTHPLRTRCRMRASGHTGTARRHTPGDEALPVGCRSRDTCSPVAYSTGPPSTTHRIEHFQIARHAYRHAVQSRTEHRQQRILALGNLNALGTLTLSSRGIIQTDG